MYDQRNFAIFSLTEIDEIDFTQVLETSAETLRKSVDGTKSFVKWDGEQPEFVSTLETLEGPYTYTEILDILSGPEWSAPMETVEEEPELVRARDENGRFIPDDPSTPDVNEAWEVI
jgi:hypothetical protein